MFHFGSSKPHEEKQNLIKMFSKALMAQSVFLYFFGTPDKCN